MKAVSAVVDEPHRSNMAQHYLLSMLRQRRLRYRSGLFACFLSSRSCFGGDWVNQAGIEAVCGAIKYVC